ncbi:bactofilin family protein [Intestinirhabdus alba]|nr:polymer-forming cytoskeletal protein [Intestinirhabdus alba]
MKILKRNKNSQPAKETKKMAAVPETRAEENKGPDAAADGVEKKANCSDTLIAYGTVMTGVLTVEGNIVVEGVVEGNIVCHNRVNIAEGGQVKGDIQAKLIVINGKITGRCDAHSVTLQEKAQAEGDICTAGLVIEKGAVFSGHSLPGKAAETSPAQKAQSGR